MIFRALLITCLVVTTSMALNYPPNRPGCGQRPLANMNRIYNGKEAIPGDWAWQVSLTDFGNHFCGGALINSQWVLTAAHCFLFPVNGLTIDLGIHDRNAKESWGVSRKASKVIIHEQFDINIMRDDIALIKLDTPVNIDDRYIIEACMPEPQMDVVSQTGWVTGWGAENLGGPATTKLMQVSLPILSDGSCKQRYDFMVDTERTVCAGEYTVDMGACQGDSGGPFVVQSSGDGKWYLVGLTSWGQDGCGFGTVFTRVSYYLDWISAQMAVN